MNKPKYFPEDRKLSQKKGIMFYEGIAWYGG
jgi:hypothetical protein